MNSSYPPYALTKAAGGFDMNARYSAGSATPSCASTVSTSSSVMSQWPWPNNVRPISGRAGARLTLESQEVYRRLGPPHWGLSRRRVSAKPTIVVPPPREVMVRLASAVPVLLRRGGGRDVRPRRGGRHVRGRHRCARSQAPPRHRRRGRAPTGLREFYGTSVHHCPYCDGWENRDRPLAVYGEPGDATDLAVSLLTWSRDLVVCTNGVAPGRRARRRLSDANIPVRSEKVLRLEGANGRLERIVFAEGAPPLERHALFFTTGQHQRSPLAERLGCTLAY